MDLSQLSREGHESLERIAGFLNFSSGSPDVQFPAALNRLFGILEHQGEGSPSSSPPAWKRLGSLLERKIDALSENVPAFRDAQQVRAIRPLVWDHVLPAYLDFHRDLLFHQSDVFLMRPFFIARVCEAVLAIGGPWDETKRFVESTITRLNDFIGHRPVATLESRTLRAYDHEWTRPIPLYIEGAGAAVGPYRELIEQALTILQETDDDLLRAASFDIDLLQELAVDPRAYDFDHPVNKRPNYHFGQWDPHNIDNRGRYRRFVLQQVTLDAVLDRVNRGDSEIHDELLYEAAAVLAGTMLMASGISGDGPDAHDSHTTLSSLLPGIAAYRDAFYQRLLERTSGARGQRLRKDTKEKKQALGGARQQLNTYLTERRAVQLQHVHLARISARMGYPDAARKQAEVVPVASARMTCQIDCQMTSARQSIEAGELSQAASRVADVIDMVHRAIECGALVDPWNILGFDAHYSLFPAMENSVHDARVDELVALIEEIFALYARIWSEAAANDDQAVCQRIDSEFRETATWWYQFAAHEVTNIEAMNALTAHAAAGHVAKALNLWHKGGASAGDIGFWASHAEMFDSPNAYALVVDALLGRRDYVASMALLIHWLSQADHIRLEERDASYFHLSEKWMRAVSHASTNPPPAMDEERADQPIADFGQLVIKFFDYIEANAETYWEVPDFELGSPENTGKNDSFDADEDLEGEDVGLYGAAYEEVVFRDSTDDGIEADILGDGAYSSNDDEFRNEADRIAERLTFVASLARLWRLAAFDMLHQSNPNEVTPSDNGWQSRRTEVIRSWNERAAEHSQKLAHLLDAVHRFPLEQPTSDQDSMIRYDARRVMKEALLERIIATAVETADAERFVLGSMLNLEHDESAKTSMREQLERNLKDDQRLVIEATAAIFRGDAKAVRQAWSELIDALEDQPLLYVPLARGGSPRKMLEARVRHRMIGDLLSWMPRLGLFTETRLLIQTAWSMEQRHPIEGGAVTQFDVLFHVGCRALVNSTLEASQPFAAHSSDNAGEADPTDGELVGCLEQMIQSLLVIWLTHSRTLRLSVLEKVADAKNWNPLVSFIERYGGDLFTQRFLNPGNLRAILHQGADAWIERLRDADFDEAPKFIDDLDGPLPREEAVEQLSVICEAIIENYNEYRDYNSTTTQSDRGEMLYSLLDFLRLRVAYDRVTWNLEPVVAAHELLVRCGRTEAAELWRRAVAQRTSEEADRYLVRLAKLQKKYSMRMPSVAVRLSERFVRSMAVDRVRALVEPAIRESTLAGPTTAFDLLQQETSALAHEPIGVGFDLPAWLEALAEEVQRVSGQADLEDDWEYFAARIPRRTVSLDDIQQQIDSWSDLDN